MLEGTTIDTVLATWDQGEATVVEPTPGVDGTAVRQMYAEHVPDR